MSTNEKSSKVVGQWEAIKADVKEGVGKVTGSEKLKEQGQEAERSAARHRSANTNTSNETTNSTASAHHRQGTYRTENQALFGGTGNQYNTGRGTGRGPNDHDLQNKISGSNTGYGANETSADRTSHTFAGGDTIGEENENFERGIYQ